MLKRPAVALIAPFVAQDLARASEEGGHPAALTRMAGRGELQLLPEHADLEPWRVGLLTTLGLADAVDRYPEGAVIAASGGNDAEACWLRATPLNFTAGLNDLAANPLSGPNAVSGEHRAQLAATLAAHLRASGFALETVRGEWVVRAPRVLNAVTKRPDLAVQDLGAAMPAGPDARELRRLMAELQMLLHEHEVNEHRARTGLPAANAIWLHGLGSAGRAERVELPAAFGDDLYLQGVYGLHGRSVQAAPCDADILLACKSPRALAVVDAATLDVLEERWLTPLVRALRAHLIDDLELVIARWRITLTRGASLKVWRGARPLARWPA
jgi:hypothetical protein